MVEDIIRNDLLSTTIIKIELPNKMVTMLLDVDDAVHPARDIQMS
jgi:hypothetical protein